MCRMGRRPWQWGARQFVVLGLMSGRACSLAVGGRALASPRLLAPSRRLYSKSPLRFQLLASTDAFRGAGVFARWLDEVFPAAKYQVSPLCVDPTAHLG